MKLSLPRRAIVLCAFAALLAPSIGAVHAQPATTQVERGKYLVEGPVACANCHTARGPQGRFVFEKGLSGGMLFNEKPFTARASNITPDMETGIGKWTDAQLAKAIREGIRPDGTVIGPPMPMEFYRHLSDSDLAAIIAYLRVQAPVSNLVARSEYRIPLPPAYGPPINAPVIAPPVTDKLAYGKYVADTAHCMECHTPRGDRGMLQTGKWGAGGQIFGGPWGQSISRNLTPDASGLKDWSDAQIENAVRNGKDRDGNPYKPPMAFSFYKNISDTDMSALLAYLRSLKPAPFTMGQ